MTADKSLRRSRALLGLLLTGAGVTHFTHRRSFDQLISD